MAGRMTTASWVMAGKINMEDGQWVTLDIFTYPFTFYSVLIYLLRVENGYIMDYFDSMCTYPSFRVITESCLVAMAESSVVGVDGGVAVDGGETIKVGREVEPGVDALADGEELDQMFLSDLDGDLEGVLFPEIELGEPVVEASVISSPSVTSGECTALAIPGLRVLPDPSLASARKGVERLPSEHNDRWALRRADQLRAALKWDMVVPLGDVPLDKLNDLLSHLFSRVTKVRGGEYPSSTYMNMCNCFNRILRRASDLRALGGVNDVLERDFNIVSHPAFTKTRLVLKAALKKSAREGVNKKRLKCEIVTEEMEKAILVDIDHQITSNSGCQKHLAFYFLVRLGIRGGKELHKLLKRDVHIKTNSKGANYVIFQERESKNNNYTLQKYNEEQFRVTYHSYEIDFVLCLKQYMRHLPPEGPETKPDLFLCAITNLVTNVWYNRVHKMSRDRCAKWLANMASLVGLPPDLFTNRSGRATLVTRMTARGVPDKVGMLVTGHHSSGGYSRYDRTRTLKMDGATFVSANPDMTYEKALTSISKNFVEEGVVGNSNTLKPLVEHVSGSTSTVALIKEKSIEDQPLKICDNPGKYEEWHKEYDQINWEEAMTKDPVLAKHFGGGNLSKVNVGSSIAGSTFNNCTINISIRDTEDKENRPI